MEWLEHHLHCERTGSHGGNLLPSSGELFVGVLLFSARGVAVSSLIHTLLKRMSQRHLLNDVNQNNPTTSRTLILEHGCTMSF